MEVCRCPQFRSDRKLCQSTNVGGEITNFGPHEQTDPNVKRVFECLGRDWTAGSSVVQMMVEHQRLTLYSCIVSAPTLVRNEELRDQLANEIHSIHYQW